MKISVALKRILTATGLIAVVVSVFLVDALAGLRSQPVSFIEPPAFVTQYAANRYGTDSSVAATNLTKDYFNEAAMVRNVIVNEEPTDELIKLFTHMDKAQRVRIAFAFADVNFKLSHDEGTGFDDKRARFWERVNDYSADIQNALFEALISSAEEQTRNFIPYTLAWWMQEDKPKATEMLAWAAKHHSDPWVRNFSVYYVVQFSENEKHAEALIKDRSNDPVFRVRKQVLEQRVRRFKEMVFGNEE